jgi:hypothetical protein
VSVCVCVWHMYILSNIDHPHPEEQRRESRGETDLQEEQRTHTAEVATRVRRQTIPSVSRVVERESSVCVCKDDEAQHLK